MSEIFDYIGQSLITQTLTVFLAKILAKRYTNPSSDIIEVLAGLDNVDSVFTELVATLDTTIRSGRSRELPPCKHLNY